MKRKGTGIVNRRAINHARRAYYRDSFRAEAKEERERIKALNEQKKDELNEGLNMRYNCYKHIMIIGSDLEIEFTFDSLKEKYNVEEFEYKEKYPSKKNDSKFVKIPRETFLENIFKSLKNRRIKKIETKSKLQFEEAKEFEKVIKEYENKKQKELLRFQEEEAERKKKIDEKNIIAENYKKAYTKGEASAIEKYNAELLKQYKNLYPVPTFETFGLAFVNGKLDVSITILFDNLPFDYISVKHLKTKGVLEGKPIKIEEVKKIMKEFIPGLAIFVIDLIYKNDKSNNIELINISIKINENEALTTKFHKIYYSDIELKNYATITELFWFDYKYKFPNIQL